MNEEIDKNRETEDIEKMLEDAGSRFANATSSPSRSVLKMAINMGFVENSVTNSDQIRYNLGKEDSFLQRLQAYIKGRVKVLVPITVAVAVLVIGVSGRAYYIKPLQTAFHAVTNSSQKKSPASLNNNAGQKTATQSDNNSLVSNDDVDQILSQIDSQMSGLSDDNQNMDQSIH